MFVNKLDVGWQVTNEMFKLRMTKSMGSKHNGTLCYQFIVQENAPFSMEKK